MYGTRAEECSRCRYTEELSAGTRNSALQSRYSKPQKWRVVRPNLLSDFWNSKHVMLYTK